MKYLYVLIDFFTIIIPFIFSFHPKLKFYQSFKAFFLANLIVAVVFILWDVYYTRLGVWGFSPEYITGKYIFNLPIEEILFFICIPFSCVFTYHCLNRFYRFHWSSSTESMVILSFSTILLWVGLFYHSKLYTSVTLISLSIILLVLKYIIKINWLAKLILIYPVLLIPFFIVNGILTGTGISHPVVWYDAAEIIGIRIMTIPIEDVFYGFELILLNIFLYEFFKRKLYKSI